MSDTGTDATAPDTSPAADLVVLVRVPPDGVALGQQTRLQRVLELDDALSRYGRAWVLERLDALRSQIAG